MQAYSWYRTNLPYAYFIDDVGTEYLLNRKYEVIAQRRNHLYSAFLVDKTFFIENVVEKHFFYNDSTSPVKNASTRKKIVEVNRCFMENKVIPITYSVNSFVEVF